MHGGLSPSLVGAIFHVHKLITQCVLPYTIGDPLDALVDCVHSVTFKCIGCIISSGWVVPFGYQMWFLFDDELHLHMFLGAASLCLMHSFWCRQVREALLICLIMSIPQSGDLNRIIMPFDHFRKCIRCEHC
eukprot:99992_1